MKTKAQKAAEKKQREKEKKAAQAAKKKNQPKDEAKTEDNQDDNQQGKYWRNKVGCVFPMVILIEFRLGQYSDDDHPKNAPHFNSYS